MKLTTDSDSPVRRESTNLRELQRCRPAVFLYEQCAVGAVSAVENSIRNSNLVTSSVSSSADSNGSRVYATVRSL
ncbi:uncharacterized protein SPSK_00362 [Sporothrix schenckii 1099-18]|uniref:Uncharacterized protein n=1 Tax=Sporothrix schenckii 1099-18 TaxID=1397361 RepID=A0A0F2M5H8_SPOSC|nr:uncharacterized protein SPSK_00362 [Sporothrix schenckii 1099-18]KJR84045.1 hypothetical protein SPSK_00362 [Sporothrix schenckii 1099-18]